MKSEWSDTTLGGFVRLQRGHDLTASEQLPGKVPIMGSAGPNGTHNKSLAKGPGVVIGRSGASAGKVHYCPVDYWPHNTCLYVTDFLGNNPRYAYYLLQTVNLAAFNSGSAQPSLNRNFLYNIPLRVPSRTEQDRIAAILEALDDEIDSLNKQSKAIEGVARTLFRSWFVNFNPVHAKAAGSKVEGFTDAVNELFPSEFIDSPYGQIPKGWSWESLDEHITYLNGLALQKFPPIEGEATLPVLKIAQLRAGRTDPTVLANRKMKPEFIVKDGDIIFSWSGSLEVKVWTGGEAALNQHLFKVFSEKHPAWFCYQATLRHLASFRDTAASKATTMGHIQRHHLTEAKIAVPPEELMPKFSDIFKPLHDSIVVNGLLVRELEELRNHVLPRLVTGRLTVEAAAEAVQELAAA